MLQSKSKDEYFYEYKSQACQRIPVLEGLAPCLIKHSCLLFSRNPKHSEKSDFYSVFDLEWKSAGRPGLELYSVKICHFFATSDTKQDIRYMMTVIKHVSPSYLLPLDGTMTGRDSHQNQKILKGIVVSLKQVSRKTFIGSCVKNIVFCVYCFFFFVFKYQP